MPTVDVCFRLNGDFLPADHGYLLYSAVSKLIPELHASEGIGLHPVSGRLAGDRRIAITNHSALIVRADASWIPQLLPLAGKVLMLSDCKVRAGLPETRALCPSARLYSRLVTIKGFTEPQPFLDAVQRQLDDLGVKGKPTLVEQPQVAAENEGRPGGSRSPVLRRTIRIRDKEIVGFALRVEELTADESIRLQEIGIGGRRRFGCGVFIPDRS